MEPLAENRFTVTKELFYEGMLRVVRESHGPFIKKVMLVLAAAWAVLAAFTLLKRGSLAYAVVELVVVVLIGVWLSVEKLGVLVARDGFVSGDTDTVQALIEEEMGETQ